MVEPDSNAEKSAGAPPEVPMGAPDEKRAPGRDDERERRDERHDERDDERAAAELAGEALAPPTGGATSSSKIPPPPSAKLSSVPPPPQPSRTPIGGIVAPTAALGPTRPSETSPAAANGEQGARNMMDVTAPVAPPLSPTTPEATVAPHPSPSPPPEERFPSVNVGDTRAAAEGSPQAKASAPSLSELASSAGRELEARAVAEAKDAHFGARSSARARALAASSTSATTSDVRPLAAYELLARSARLPDLVAIARTIVGEGAQTRSSKWSFEAEVASAAEEARLTREDADTRFGNALDVLATGGIGPGEHALACALWAHAVAESPRARTEDEDSVTADVLWLAAHTSFDATTLLDRACGEDAADLWAAIAEHVRRIERGKPGALGRGEAVVACAALAASGTDQAKALCEQLANELSDPVLVRILAAAVHTMPEEVRLEGELLPPQRGPVATTLLALSGLLFVIHALRLLGRVALAYRCPAEVSLSETGVRVKTRTELLGRTLREREHVILRSGLVRVVREVRFPRLAFYTGLFALALGSYFGVRALADGVRAASPSLLLVGLLIVAVGIGADFLLGTLLPGIRGRCRMAFVPRIGPTLSVGNVDARRADDALTRSLARR